MPKVIFLQEWEINAILDALAEQPYNRVAEIIQHIKEQIVRNEPKESTP